MNVEPVIEPETYIFKDDGLVPNNPLPFLVYRAAIDVANDHPEETIEGLFGAHGWGDMWRDGVFDYLHFHSMIHEAMGVARGRARVQFGGDGGEEVELRAGDAALLPAGTGHQRVWASDDFCVIGAYPKAGTYNLIRPTKSAHDEALGSIPQVPLPAQDPVFGTDGPVMRLWRK
jgi:uncharacterized protein YjlB